MKENRSRGNQVLEQNRIPVSGNYKVDPSLAF